MKVIAGDWFKGATVNLGRKITIPVGFFKTDEYDYADIIDFQVVTEENKASILGKVGWGALGTIALGPLGLLAGVLGGGNRRDRVMTIEFADGRKMLAKGDSKDAERLMAATFSRNHAMKTSGKLDPTF